MVKRAFDVVVSLVALIVLSPLLAAIALVIKFGSPGPVFFRQERVGMSGERFRIVKFRTMVPGADRIAPNVSPAGDPRVTRVGKFLRKWYLDELPQLFNVLKGDMSLVGPRPETPEFVAHYTPDERKVLEVRPGMAGPSTLVYMDEAELLAAADDGESYYLNHILHERVRLDLQYLHRRSITYDVRLLFRQALSILGRRSVPPPGRP